MRPTILAFNLSLSRLNLLKLAAIRLNLAVETVQPLEQSRTVGDLFGLGTRAATAHVPPVFDAEMLIFGGMENQQINALLSTLRQMQVPPFPLKAILTPTNAAWRCGELYAELCKERQQFQR